MLASVTSDMYNKLNIDIVFQSLFDVDISMSVAIVRPMCDFLLFCSKF